MHTLAIRPNILNLVLIKHDAKGTRLNDWAYEHPKLFLMNNLILNTLRVIRVKYLLARLQKIATYVHYLTHANTEMFTIWINIFYKRQWMVYMPNEIHFINGMLHRDNGYAIVYDAADYCELWNYGKLMTDHTILNKC